MLIFIRNILQLILSAARGWEDVGATPVDTHRLVTHCVFPLFAVSALSVFVKMLYGHDLSFAILLVYAIVTFVSYFVTFYFALIMFRSYFDRFTDHEPNERKMTVVIAYGISLLAVCNILCNILPLHMGLEYLLPLAVILIVWKANVYLTVRSDKDLAYVLFVIVSIILPPVLVRSLFIK